MKKLSKQHRFFLAIAAIITAVLLVTVNQNLFPLNAKTMVSVTAAPLSDLNKPLRITRAGSIESATSIPINADFSGQLVELYVKEGQTVKAGQPLFKLEGSYEQTITQPATSPQTQGSYEKALDEYTRYQKLFEIGAISRRQLDTAATKLQEAQSSGANVQSQTASYMVNGSVTVTAPISGVVTGLTTGAGNSVQAGQKLLSLGSGQEVEVVVPITQNDLYLVHLGTPATIETAQTAVSGQVSRIYPLVEADKNPSFLAHIKLTNNPAGSLKSGMPVNVSIDTGQTAAVRAVPTASIIQDSQGLSLIFIAADGKAKLQQVTIGETNGDYTEITSNLPQQALVITSNLTDIKNGDSIALIQ